MILECRGLEHPQQLPKDSTEGAVLALLTHAHCGSIVDCIRNGRTAMGSVTEREADEGLDLKTLEARIDQLIEVVGSLASENNALRTHASALMSERAALIEKTELARAKVEAMIARLKAMETHS